MQVDLVALTPSTIMERADVVRLDVLQLVFDALRKAPALAEVALGFGRSTTTKKLTTLSMLLCSNLRSTCARRLRFYCRSR